MKRPERMQFQAFVKRTASVPTRCANVNCLAEVLLAQPVPPSSFQAVISLCREALET